MPPNFETSHCGTLNIIFFVPRAEGRNLETNVPLGQELNWAAFTISSSAFKEPFRDTPNGG